ncbi:glycosyltransferase family 2 protein [Phenylobacterium sp.]|jgi:succinoglycan biosynthesis protein ExoA|uniref:glycosyltransferase family 2 protein n=1 Tax=Phenylobacterium sp. TaxID=1871053 RepID=UPI002F94D888
MFSSKPVPGRPSQPASDDRTSDDGLVRAFAEPRSFAPMETRQGGMGEIEARWPAAWEDLEADAFIEVHTPRHEPEVMGDPRRALIVIPALNEAKVIARVIDQILADEGLVDPLVLVADGGSTDGTRDIVRRIAERDPRVRLMPNPGKLQSAGVNLAARLLGGDRPWLVRVDAHADYPANYASTLIEEARRTHAHSVVVSMDTRGENWFQRAVAAAQNSVLGTGGSAHRLATQGQWVDHGHHALFHAESFEKVGGYDESFSHNEDAELDYRLNQAGGRIWLTDKVRIGYYPRSTPKALWKQYFSYGKGRARTVLKHFTPLKIRQAVPLAIAPAVASLALTPFFWAFALPALLWAFAALSLGVVVGVKQRDAAALVSGPAAMIMHLAWSAGFWAQLFTWRASPGAGGGMMSPQAAS